MEKKLHISDLKKMSPGRTVALPLMVLTRQSGRTSRGDGFLSLELGDRTGRLSAKAWSPGEHLLGQLQEGEVSLVRGRIDSFKGLPQLIVMEAELLMPDEWRLTDYVRAPAQPLDAMKADLLA
ncbi:MAG: hypothetical protein LBU12_00190, partial [Deltaproteobacteria bacterium]|nr:hypothetical protein [Deltaproteobacteria bacterium]